MSIASLTALALVAAPTVTKVATADVFVDGKKTFVLERTAHTDAKGARHLTSTFTDMSGAVVLKMEARLAGDHPVEARIEQKKTDKRGVVRLSPGRVQFEVVDAEGRKETAESEALGIVYVGPALTTWIASDGPWRRLVAGESVEFKVAAWSRLAVYEFRLRPLPDPGDGTLRLAMEPTNLLYRAFAGDMRYTFDKKTRQHLRYSGITSLVLEDEDGDLEDVTAEIVFRR